MRASRRFGIAVLAGSLAAISVGLNSGSQQRLEAQDESAQDEPAQAEAASEGPTTLDKHQGWVTCVAVAGDTLITAGGQSLQYRPGEIHLWDLKQGKHLGSLEGHKSNVWSIAVDPAGESLISTGYDGTIIVHDLKKREARATHEKPGWTRSVAVTPDGKHFATGHEDGKVVIWETASATEVKTIAAHEAAVFDLAFSPDGKTLATASTDHSAKLFAWNEEEPKELAKFNHDDAVWAVAFAPTEPLVATAGADRKIKLWDPSGKELATLEGHRDWVSDLAFSADGKQLASADQGRVVRLWDVEKRSAVADLKGYESSVWCVLFTSDNQLISGSHDDSLVIWDIAQQKTRSRDWKFSEPAPAPQPPEEPPKPEPSPSEDADETEKKPEADDDKKAEEKKAEDKPADDKKKDE